MGQKLKHLRRQAVRHHESHQRLKWLIGRHRPKKENILWLFVVTFLMIFIGLMAWRNRSAIQSWFEPSPVPPAIVTYGIKTGTQAVVQIERQATATTPRIPTTQGVVTGTKVSGVLGQKAPETKPSETARSAAELTQTLSTGQHLTQMDQTEAKALLKSVVATFYLGKKAEDVDSMLSTDTALLKEMKNVLSVDLFQFLNQSDSRADALAGYLNLLKILRDRCDQRISDLDSKIAFLSSAFKGQETAIGVSEKTFFDQLKNLEGPGAEGELSKFIGLQQGQAETRARLGAFESLQGYFKFFRPRLDNLIRTIEANRDPLIAGVKVVEIQNMALPLIIQQK